MKVLNVGFLISCFKAIITKKKTNHLCWTEQVTQSSSNHLSAGGFFSHHLRTKKIFQPNVSSLLISPQVITSGLLSPIMDRVLSILSFLVFSNSG